jgi:hypothetical protein
MKTSSILVLVCLLFASVAVAQDADKTAVLKEFTRTSTYDGVVLSFVHLNDRTVEILFQAPGKYALRARANISTMLYVQGVPEKNIQVDTNFSLVQGGETTKGTIQNIKNFEGTAVKGQRIDAIVQFEKKVNIAKEFEIRNGANTIKFKLSAEALKLLEKPEAAKPAGQ